MTADQAALKLRFRSGRYEQQLIYLILILQLSLAAMLVVVTVGWIYLILGSYFDPNSSTAFYLGVVPYLIGGVVVLFLLTLVYE